MESVNTKKPFEEIDVEYQPLSQPFFPHFSIDSGKKSGERDW